MDTCIRQTTRIGSNFPYGIAERHFRKNTAEFAKFNPDPKSATPMSVPRILLKFLCIDVRDCFEYRLIPTEM